MPFAVGAVLFGLLAALASYFLGSINSAIIVTWSFHHTDVREHGSGNAGMANAFRTGGVRAAVLTFLGDLVKSVAAVAIGRYLLPLVLIHFTGLAVAAPHYAGVYWTIGECGAYLCGLFCIIGHLYPIYYGFRGGKGIVASAGMMLLVDWHCLAVCLVVFGIVFLATRIASASSIAAAFALPFATFFLFGLSYPHAIYNPLPMGPRLFATLFSVVIMLVLLSSHKDNILRIFKGRERPLKVEESSESARETEKTAKR